MDINPYSSPAAIEGTTNQDDPAVRPLGISLLSALIFIGGLLFAGLIGFLAFSDDPLRNSRPFPPNSLVVVVGIAFTLFIFATSVGMWLGKKWAWWFAAWYYFSMLVGNLCQPLLILPIKFKSLDSDEVIAFMAKQMIGAIINSLLLCYLLKFNVRRFFGLSGVSKIRALGILLAVTLLFVFVVAALTTAYFFSQRR
jgi:hypothetical protein